MALKTRRPTGRTGWPRIVVEGGDKAGKSYKLAELSASPKVGRTVVLVLGEDESKWDEFGQIEGARFELAVHDGTWASMMGVLADAKEEAARAVAAGEPPFVLGIDTVTAMWDGLKDWASLRARSSKKAKALLAQDPDAEIDVSPNYHNDKRARWRQGLIRYVLTFPGIVVMVARGREVTLFQNGQPVVGRTTWSIEAENNLVYDASVHVRLARGARPLLVSLASVKNGIMPGDPPEQMPNDWTLERLIFERIKLDPASAVVPEFVEFKQELTPEQIAAEVLNPETTLARITELWPVVRRSFPAVEVDGELLLETLKREGARRKAAAAPKQQQAASAAAVRAAGLDADDPWAAKVEEITEGDYTAARETLEEAADMLGRGELDAEHYARIVAAIEARFPDADAKAAQVARPAAA